MFGKIRDAAATLALRGVKEKLVNPQFWDIGIIRELFFKDGKLFLTVELKGLEDRPIEVCANDISIADDGSEVRIGAFESNMPFAHNALNRFATQVFRIPEGMGRLSLVAVKKTLGL